MTSKMCLIWSEALLEKFPWEAAARSPDGKLLSKCILGIGTGRASGSFSQSSVLQVMLLGSWITPPFLVLQVMS